MNQNFSISLLVFVAVATGSLFSRLYGLYDAYWFTDIVLHTLSGVGFGFLWLFLGKREISRFMVALGSVSFAVFGSLLWEYGELGAWKFIPFYAPFYSPNFFDTVGDITSGLVGGALSSLTVFRQKK
jgi:hypothetical protein